MDSAPASFSDGRHVFPIRVYFEDTDAGRMVYYANYLRYAERARTELLRLAGAEHSSLMERERIMLAVRRCDAEFLSPAYLDDALEVHSEITELRGASLRASQSVRRGDRELVRMALRLACITLEGRPARIPARLMQALEPFCKTPIDPSYQ